MAVIDEAEARRRLAEARVGRLATVGPDGAPHVVPFVFAVHGDTLYWAVDAKPKRSNRIQRLTNIEANPVVQVVVDHYAEDWEAVWWVRAIGRARILSQGAEANHGRALLAAKYPQYRADPPPGPVVAIDIRRVTGWSAR
jgi:PPOX class probable F420-dependent enzyme